MSDAEIVGLTSLFINLLVLAITAIISGRISSLKSFMFENFVTHREYDVDRRESLDHYMRRKTP